MQERIEAVRSYVQTHIRYVRERVEVVEHPLDTVEVRGADCDGHAVLVATLLEALGVPARLEFVGPADVSSPIHTYAAAWNGACWEPVDTVLDALELSEMPRCWLADGRACDQAPPAGAEELAGALDVFRDGWEGIRGVAATIGSAFESAVSFAIDRGARLWGYVQIGWDAFNDGVGRAWEFVNRTLVDALTDEEWWASLLIAGGVCLAEALFGDKSGDSTTDAEYEVQGIDVATSCSGAVENFFDESKRVFLSRVEDETGLPARYAERLLRIDFSALNSYEWHTVHFDEIALPDLERLIPGQVPGMRHADSVRLAEAKLRAELDRQWSAFVRELGQQSIADAHTFEVLAGDVDDQLDEATRRELARIRGELFRRGAFELAGLFLHSSGHGYLALDDQAIPLMLWHGAWKPPTRAEILTGRVAGHMDEADYGLRRLLSLLGSSSDLLWLAAGARIRVDELWAELGPDARPGAVAQRALVDEIERWGFSRVLLTTDEAIYHLQILVAYAREQQPRPLTIGERQQIQLEQAKTAELVVLEIGETSRVAADLGTAEAALQLEQRRRRLKAVPGPGRRVADLVDEFGDHTTPIHVMPDPVNVPPEPSLGDSPESRPLSGGGLGALAVIGLGILALKSVA